MSVKLTHAIGLAIVTAFIGSMIHGTFLLWGHDWPALTYPLGCFIAVATSLNVVRGD
jgi:hypothetical protein